jgi:hypothetical protein
VLPMSHYLDHRKQKLAFLLPVSLIPGHRQQNLLPHPEKDLTSAFHEIIFVED